MVQVRLPNFAFVGRTHGKIAQIISGFISFGTLHIRTKGFEPWQWCVAQSCILHAEQNPSQAYDHHGCIDIHDGCVLLVKPSLP